MTERDVMRAEIDAPVNAERQRLARQISENRQKFSDAFEKLDAATKIEIAEKMGLVGKIRRFVPSESDPTQAVPVKDPTAEIERLQVALREARRPALCGVCGGQPLASGRRCVCNGEGTEAAEMAGLRLELYESAERESRLQLRLEAMRDAMGLLARRCQRGDFLEHELPEKLEAIASLDTLPVTHTEVSDK